MDDKWLFVDARQALFWSMEVLRRRRMPTLCRLWRDMEKGTAIAEGQAWEEEVVSVEWRQFLPQGGDDRLCLALDVATLLTNMGEDGKLLEKMALGDWYSDAALRMALVMQEKMRRQGVRVLVNYRYTFRQLAEMEGVDAKAVWRRCKKALQALDGELRKKGLI